MGSAYFRELHHFSRKALQGHYGAAWAAVMLELLLRLGGWLVPAVIAALCIRRGTLSPAALFTRPLWMLFTALWGILMFTIRIPVQCGIRSWFTSLTELESPAQPRRFFPTAGRYFHALYFFGTAELIRSLAALPAVLAGTGALLLFRRSSGIAEGGLWLFAAVQALSAMCWAIWFYVRFSASLAAVPYLYLNDPHRGIFRTIRDSRRMLSGQHHRLFAVVLPYAAALPATGPFLLPQLMTDMTLFLQLRIREYEQAQTMNRGVLCLN